MLAHTYIHTTGIHRFDLDDRDEVLADDARRCRCIRVGSTSGKFASRAKSASTVNIEI